MTLENICMCCMEASNQGQCEHCNFDIAQYDKPPHHLPMGSILTGKYLVGKAIGEGGFGITYIGFDLNLEMKVAIKEYYPSGFVTRENSISVSAFSGDKGEFFINGRGRFLDEAKSLAKFSSEVGVVSVREFFLENQTAYIVMEYIEGLSFKAHLALMGGKLASEQVFRMMKPVMMTLHKIHKAGIIHRDISPDNLIITKDGTVKLIDFGAARNYIKTDGKSLSIMLKPGYAPEEQYRRNGVQGPWTDIYGLCATIYRCITGMTPLESNERIIEDTLTVPSQQGIAIHTQKERALMQGLSVFAKDRQQTMDQLITEIYVIVPPPPPPQRPLRELYQTNISRYKKLHHITVGLFVVATIIMIFSGMQTGYNSNMNTIQIIGLLLYLLSSGIWTFSSLKYYGYYRNLNYLEKYNLDSLLDQTDLSTMIELKQSKIFLGTQWFFAMNAGSLMHYLDIAWVYEATSKGGNYLVLRCTGGEGLNIFYKWDDHIKLVTAIQRRNPNVLIGRSRKNKKRYKAELRERKKRTHSIL